jgi:hypothetical protein
MVGVEGTGETAKFTFVGGRSPRPEAVPTPETAASEPVDHP